jgi:UDP-2,3-diacylglucosamine pyrophosphatase LpxH
MRQQTYFISDLHLFCRRFDGERFWQKTREAAGHARVFVLGGDIFDFRWTTMSTIEDTVDEAIRRLQLLVADNRECMFHFILGNHDHHKAFLKRLKQLEQIESNLSWHPYYFRHGASLFLHGDVASNKMNHESLKRKRSRWLHVRKRGRIANRLYDVAVCAHAHTLVYRIVYPKHVVAKRLLAYLEGIGHGPMTGVANVYFGHTHLPLSGYTHGGVRFHNCGAPVKGCTFRILEDVVSD